MTEPIPCFDSHFHIIDPKFPLVPNKGFLPKPFTSDKYLEEISHLNISLKGGAVVSGSFQAFDTSYLKNTLTQLGPQYIGVVNMSHDVNDDQILSLHKMGVRAVRFNLYRGGSETLDHLETLARRVYDLANWHVELYINTESLKEIMPLLLTLPKISIDHLGLTSDGFDDLLKLVKNGAHIKATRFSILNFDIKKVMRNIYNANPSSLMFGSDLPSTRAPRLINNEDLNLFIDTFNQSELMKVMYSNAFELYHGR